MTIIPNMVSISGIINIDHPIQPRKNIKAPNIVVEKLAIIQDCNMSPPVIFDKKKALNQIINNSPIAGSPFDAVFIPVSQSAVLFTPFSNVKLYV